MPTRTFSMSAPKRSARFASSFMKLILVASIAFAAYFVSSADLHVHDDELFAAARERLVERAQQLGDARIVGADDDAIRPHEVLDGRAFLEEFRVRHHVEFDLGTLRLSSDSATRGADLVGSCRRAPWTW